MKGRIDLTQGKITEKLVKLSLPIMATSFIQMAYNMIDMIWVGKAGSSAVAAVGTAGFFTWLAMAFITISKVGAEVKVAQSMGQHDVDETKLYIKSAIEINIILSILYTIFLIMFKDQLIGFFRLGDENVISMSKEYLVIVAFGMIFYFINPVFTAIFNGMGNSKTPFLINTIGLLTNIVLDPILILGLGKIPSMGVAGAAIATVVAQIVVTSCFMLKILKKMKYQFKMPILVTIITYGIFSAQLTPVLYAQNASFPPRLLCIVYYSMYWLVIINIFYWLGYINNKIEITEDKNSYRYCYIIILLIGIMCVTYNYKSSNSYIAIKSIQTGEAIRYKEQMEERIKKYKDKNIQDVEVEKIREKPYLLFISDLTENPEDWLNGLVRDFYSKNSVKIISRRFIKIIKR